MGSILGRQTHRYGTSHRWWVRNMNGHTVPPLSLRVLQRYPGAPHPIRSRGDSNVRQSGQTDVATGHVTGFILDHSTIPVLMVRKQHLTEEAHTFSDVKSSGVRVPNKMNDG